MPQEGSYDGSGLAELALTELRISMWLLDPRETTLLNAALRGGEEYSYARCIPAKSERMSLSYMHRSDCTHVRPMQGPYVCEVSTGCTPTLRSRHVQHIAGTEELNPFHTAGKLRVLELIGPHRPENPCLWTAATTLTCLSFSGLGYNDWPELHRLSGLKSLTFSQ